MTDNISDKLKESFKAGTESKQGLKKFAALAPKVLAIGITIVLLFWIVFYMVPDGTEDQVAAQSPPVKVAEERPVTFVWKEPMVRGFVPMNVWSQSIANKNGCRRDLGNKPEGNGTSYKVQTQDPDGGWVDREPGSIRAALATRVMTLTQLREVVLMDICG